MQRYGKAVRSAINMRLDAMEAVLPELGRKLLAMQAGELGIDRKSNEVDLVTRADHASEAFLLDRIREAFAEDGILAEEGGSSDDEAQREGGFRWVLDPIDGTVNYANRLPVWAISIGLLFEGEPVGGLIAAPGLGDIYRAVRGGGSTRNGDPIRVHPGERLRSGIVGTGFPYDRAERAEPLSRAIAAMLRASGGVRRMGAAALDFCFVADGRFIGYYELGLKPWDSAAGSLIAEEAGARVTDLYGAAFDLFGSRGVIAANERVHGSLCAAVEPLRHGLS